MSTIIPTDAHQRNRGLAVSNGAGQARHFRVQFRPAPDESWQRFGSYDQPEAATHCVEKLQRDGYAARLVQFSIPPFAG